MKRKLRIFKMECCKVSHIFASYKIVGIALLFVMIFSSATAFAQRRSNNSFDEIGVFLGAGYYNGEICPTRPFYKPQFAIGMNIRHTFNERVALTFQAIRCEVQGDDLDFDDAYQQERKAKFKNELVELSLQAEFNFLPLTNGSKYNYVSPYIAAGPGLVVGSFPGEGLQFCVPFGVGVKIAPTKRFTFSVEWKYRKTFTDVLDHITEDMYEELAERGLEPTKQRSFLGDKDWYSFAGVVFSFRMGRLSSNGCPAYQ